MILTYVPSFYFIPMKLSNLCSFLSVSWVKNQLSGDEVNLDFWSFAYAASHLQPDYQPLL